MSDLSIGVTGVGGNTPLRGPAPAGGTARVEEDGVVERMTARHVPEGLPLPVGGGAGAGGSGMRVGRLDGVPSGVLGAGLTETQQRMVASLSCLLGMDIEGLLGSLRAGVPLADLVGTRGISSADLAGVIQEGLLFDTFV
jgi:hypothetical protein